MSTPITTSNTCFDNVIGITGNCEPFESVTGFNANDVDITPDFINEIITREYTGVRDFHEKKLAFAVKDVIGKIKTFLTPTFKATSLIDSMRAGIYQDNLTLVAGDGNLKGINVDLSPCDSYVDLFVAEVSLQVNYTGDVDVLVYDLVQNKLLDTITVGCTANEISRAFPRKTYRAEKQKLNLIFVYDSTGISANTTHLNKNGCSGCGNKRVFLSNPYMKITPVKIDPADSKIADNLTAIAETGGLSIVQSLSCNHESWMCSYLQLIAPAILYRYATIVYEFGLHVSPSERVNPTTNINTEGVKLRAEKYHADFKSEMKFILENIQTPRDRECFKCKDPVRTINLAM